MSEVSEIDLSEVTSQDALHFKLPVFEGPLDLLLHLIKENKIDIYDIPIALITQQYLKYLELMKELNLDIAGEFLVMAATLIYIKSRMLFPPDETQTEEPVEDPKAELVRRLLQYQAFKEASIDLRGREDVWRNIFHRSIPLEEAGAEHEPLLLEVSLFDLISAFKNLLSKAPPETIEITRETLTVADKINHILERLEKDNGVRFEELFVGNDSCPEGNYTRMTLIVTFLALLEVVRLGLAKVYQEKAFGTIWIVRGEKVS